MSTPAAKNIMLALLSLDACSRRKLPKLTYKDEIALFNQVGNATVLANSKDMKGIEHADLVDFNVGAYSWTVSGSNETMIAHRGTDFITNGGFPSIETLKDIITDWSSSFGRTDEPRLRWVPHRMAAFAREWCDDWQRELQTAGRGTFVPLVFEPSEALQFD